MKKLIKHIFFVLFIPSLTLSFITSSQSEAFKHPRKLRRSESFWGLHFDRHVQPGDDHLGATLTEEMLDSLINMGRPDYIQVDCKGHPGFCSYPTLVGQQAISYDKDPLALIRKVTNAHNLSLYLHYSGVQDRNYVKLHPDEACLGPDGKPDERVTSLWGPYVDKMLIPQVLELIKKYKVDGIWIDGDCWSAKPDYQPAALKEFTQKTGIKEIPLSSKDENYKSFLEVNRQKFIAYLNHYVDEIHKSAPDFQVCSNWAFSSLMPGPVSANVDFLSGDFASRNSIYTAAWEGRCLAGHQMPWDLMAWSFTQSSPSNEMVTPKTALQLCQEGAEAISLGGGFQVFFKQNKDISFQPSSFGIIKEVADFIIPRKEFCHGLKMIPQIGMLFSEEGWKNQVNVVYNGNTKRQEGILNALLDGQQSVEILLTHQLKKRMKEFPVIVIPEWDKIETEIVPNIRDYVKEGGKLLVIGAQGTSYFDNILGVKEVRAPETKKDYLGYDKRLVQLMGDNRGVESLQGTEVLAGLFTTTDLRFHKGTAATIKKYGKGMAAGIYADLGNSYQLSTSPVIRDLLSAIIDKLFSERMIKVEGTHKLHVVPGKIGDKLLVQLINTSGDHSNPNVCGIDEIPVLHNLKISVATTKKPEKITLQPSGTPVEFNFKDGVVYFTLQELKIHTAVEIR